MNIEPVERKNLSNFVQETIYIANTRSYIWNVMPSGNSEQSFLQQKLCIQTKENIF